MDLGLKGKRVVVFGASQGLGLSLVSGFMEEGAVVAMASRSMSKLESAIGTLPQGNNAPLPFELDVCDQDAVIRVTREMTARLGGVDIVVNNAGGAIKFGGFFELDPSDWMDTFRLNVMGVVNTSRALYTELKKSSAPRIINIASLTGLQPGEFNPHYSSSKAATINLSKHMANIFAKDEVLVNCVVPGTFDSAAWKRNIERVREEHNISLEEATKREEQLASRDIRLKRIGKSEDIVPVVLLLASEKTAWTTGATIVVDGGKLRTMH